MSNSALPKTRVLITGATGLLGRALMKVFTQPSLEHIQLVGLGWSRYEKYVNQFPNELRKLDITNDKELSEFVNEFKPNVIIHAAAERRPDQCEGDKEKTQKLNVGATEKLIELSKSVNSTLFYISSDYVFDGENPPYDIDAKTNPLSFYGKTKEESEQSIIKASKSDPSSFRYIILRVPVLYGYVENLKECAVTVVAEQVIKARDTLQPIEIDNWQIRYPTCVEDVAHVCYELMISKQYNSIYHFSAQQMKTKYDMAIDMANVLSIKDPQSIIKPMNEKPSGAPRPHNACLNIFHTVDTIKKNLNNPTIHLSIFETQLPLIFKDLKLI
ncbi:hypothetical protein RB653_005492 [Dictyostelium firmibasis]|uniref:RmlD-like substrate binding domain-containing protein n=1 Tax=Dictyostelium firmibasis TaxID=79012 RepID=A0AAN7UBL0_9MYCE